MSINNQEITINLDAKRLVAITLLAVISIYTLYSYSVALFAFIAPDNTTPFLRVTNFDSYDTSNTLEDTFAIGATARVKATVEKATDYFTIPPAYTSISGTTTAKISVSIYYDNAGTTKILKFYTTSVTLTPGVPKNIQIDVPTSTAGTYRAKIFVWDTYLPTGGNTVIDVAGSQPTIISYTGV